ncbi:T9SS type A sorting domain-containing protein [Fluviicola chungangensis]|uniref:T9SS type A sorting domain-containing protein n=1 Tax=Fluviicola chungangensis TaxID=2597671 RepID=A0A556N2J8_9FLAO|nr:T9SS type A sorting domain-containing protein [Fluviicola chungangensis]TSJ46430.1 T9SS type A sorting domain-containing protein [Fluviicola chungangensis]
MRKFITGMLLLVSLHGLGQMDTLVFKNPREMMEYAYSNTNFSNFSNPYFRNATLELEDSVFNYLTYKDVPIQCTGKGIISLFSLMNWWDMSHTFHRDSVLFPVFDHFYSLDEYGELHIPFYVVDLTINSLRPSVSEEFRNSAGPDPYRKILSNDLMEDNVIYAAAFLDSFAYNNVILELNDQTVFSNTNRTIDFVEITSGNQTKVLYFNSHVDLSDWLRGKQKITFMIHFSDQAVVQVNQDMEMNTRSSLKSTVHQNFDGYSTIYPDNYTSSSIYSPDLKYSVYYACGDKKIRKPFIVVSGWGPHTDQSLINNNQNWPTSLNALINQFNQAGLFENLHDEGFDVIVCQFFPPNAYIDKNAELLEKLINHVNNVKFQNDSYQENIIMGFSAGSLATRLALQKMEYEHLNANGPHPHTKLYISNDGEHGGANVPLGMQHAVKYLWEYEYNNVIILPGIFGGVNPLDAKTYALHYILNAPLSRELLHYFHTKTGSGTSPGQGADNLRTTYLNLHTTYNHSKNGARLGYPSFQRMISISNGSSTPSYDFSNYSSNHPPYPSQTGAIFFKQNGSLMGWVNRRFEATFLKHGTHRVFYYEYKQLFKPWKVGYEAKTKDPLVLDNAPGGIIFIEQNPIIEINNQLQSELTGAPDIEQNYLFSFTPTVLTHDVKDLSSSLNNGYPTYNFKVRNLLYQNESAAITGNPINASNYYGYPHLGYPGNHYDYTVFDALFCWDENTEHLTGNRKDPNAYAGMDSPIKGIQKNFVVEEAEPDFIFLQNLRIGFYARPNYSYRVDYEAGNTILLGNHVTQKTDFVDFVVEPNAIVDAQAVTEIHFTPGVHIKSGSDFHAHIGDITCEKALSNQNSNTSSETETMEADGYLQARTNHGESVTIFPNPSKQAFSIRWGERNDNERVSVQILDLSGKELFKKVVSFEETVIHDLKTGFYLVKLTKNGVCVTKNLVVEQ